jgi:hypothetical protein
MKTIRKEAFGEEYLKAAEMKATLKNFISYIRQLNEEQINNRINKLDVHDLHLLDSLKDVKAWLDWSDEETYDEPYDPKKYQMSKEDHDKFVNEELGGNPLGLGTAGWETGWQRSSL